MKINLFLLTFLISVSLKAQQVQQYTGEFYNGTVNPGTASYSYYIENDEKIKHGDFAYSSESKTDEGFYKTKITGKFKNNLRDGRWTYTVEFKDINTGAGNIYATGKTELTSNYNSGLPNGDWVYTSNSKSRSKEFTAFGYDWSEYYPPIVENASVTYTNGILVGEFKMNNIIMNEYKNISGQLDPSGYCIGTWKFESDQKELVLDFYKNVEIKMVLRDKNSGEVIEKSEFSDNQISDLKSFADGSISSQELLNKRIRIDTANWIESRFITLSSTFYKPLFLAEYIGGDKTYDSENYKFLNIERGLYRIFADTKSMELVSLSEIERFPMAVERIDVYAQGALNELMSIKNQYEKNLSPEDLEILDSKIALCNEKIAAKQNALNDEKAIKETEYRIKNLVNEISNELRGINQKNKASIESEYLQEYLKISGVQGDYTKTRDIQTEFFKAYDQGISFVISYLDNQLQLAGIDKGIVIGSSQNKARKSLQELNSIESEINNEKENLLAILSAYKSIYENDFKIFITYNEYEKMKSSISGVETYKLIKAPIFDSYKMLFKSDIERLNQAESNTDRLEKAQAIVKLTDKVIDLANSDSKSIEKELKKTSDKEAIRQIISN